MARERQPALAVSVHVEGVRQTLSAFRHLPKEASGELRAASLDLSRELAGFISAAGHSQGAQAALLAGLVKAKFDRVPAVQIGGSKPVGRHGTAAADLLIGSEFGMTPGGKGKGSRNFSPHGFGPRNGNQGSWIFPTVRAHEGDFARRWQAAADAIVEKFTHNPGADQ